jgi:hypothetical protein
MDSGYVKFVQVVFDIGVLAAVATLAWVGSMIYRRRFSLLEVFLLVTWIAVLCGIAAFVFGPDRERPSPSSKVIQTE